MKRTQIDIHPLDFPTPFRKLLEGAIVYDSSCSTEARVWFIDQADGFYLKSALAGTMEKEAVMTDYFHQKGLGPEVLSYVREERDWLLTRRIPGEDCLFSDYLQHPEWLCDTTAQMLRQLHDTDTTGCPVDRTADYIANAVSNYRQGHYDSSLFPDNWGYRCVEEAWKAVSEAIPKLKHDTLIHGDYCLPNIILREHRLSGFIDLGSSGLGDRHIDLFWGIWSLGFNLKTDRWTERFLDAYGRDCIQPELLAAIGAFEVFL